MKKNKLANNKILLKTLLALSVAGLSTPIYADLLTGAQVEKSSLIFQLSGPCQYHAFFLSSPNRLVIDFKNTDLSTALNTLPLGSLPVQRIRTSLSPDNTLRVVLDLKAAEHPIITPIKNQGTTSCHLRIHFAQNANQSQSTNANTIEKPVQNTALAPAEIPHAQQLALSFVGNDAYHAFMLHSPERLVVDFKNTRLIQPINQIALGDLPVWRIRSSESANKVLRIVFDLKTKQAPSMKVIRGNAGQPSQLLVDFSGTSTFTSVPVPPPAAMPVFTAAPSKTNVNGMPMNLTHDVPYTPPAPVIPAATMNNASETTRFLPMAWGRTQASALGSTGSLGIFGGDVMLPVYGNREEFAYVDMMGDGATDSTSLISPGGGYRKVYNNQIFGAYFFGDYEQVSFGENFWNLSPGVEWMTPNWDAHVNGYFPTTTSQTNGQTAFLNSYGDYSRVNFETGTHNQYDTLVTPVDIIGNGVDAEVGYSFATGNKNLRSRVYLGGYYYQANNSNLISSLADIENIPGVTAGFEQAITQNLSVAVMNSYDSVSDYTVGLQAKLILGGESNLYSNDVHSRLLDSVQRHIGLIATGAGNYDQQGYEDSGNALEYNNVYFMSTNGAGNGTYGSPMSLSQTSLDAIDTETNHSRVYLQGGSNAVYTLNSSNTTTESVDGTNQTGLFVHSGQDFYGRTEDYKAPATGNARPQVVVDNPSTRAFIVTEAGDYTFADLNISSAQSNSANMYGILAENLGGEDQILHIRNTDASLFNVGLYAINTSRGNQTLDITGSHFNNNYTTGSSSAFGVYTINASSGNQTLNVVDSQFNNNNATGSGSAYGVFALNQGSGKLTVNAVDSEFNDTSSKNTASGMFVQNTGSHGINGTMDITLSNSEFNNTTTNTSSSSGDAYGLVVSESSASATTYINIKDSQFNGTTSNAGEATGAYMYIAGGSSSILISNSQFSNNYNSLSNYAFGLNLQNYSTNGVMTADITNSEFNNNTTVDTARSAWGFRFYQPALATTTMSATNSQFNSNSTTGIFLNNASSVPSSLYVTSLYGSTLNNNGFYGLEINNSSYVPSATVVNISGITATNNGLGSIDNIGNAEVVD